LIRFSSGKQTLKVSDFKKIYQILLNEEILDGTPKKELISEVEYMLYKYGVNFTIFIASMIN
jgi:hypothetical protein